MDSLPSFVLGGGKPLFWKGGRMDPANMRHGRDFILPYRFATVVCDHHGLVDEEGVRQLAAITLEQVDQTYRELVEGTE